MSIVTWILLAVLAAIAEVIGGEHLSVLSIVLFAFVATQAKKLTANELTIGDVISWIASLIVVVLVSSVLTANFAGNLAFAVPIVQIAIVWVIVAVVGAIFATIPGLNQPMQAQVPSHG